MSTHNIGFYEDLTKIIFKISSNIIKYAPYFFCWVLYLSRTKNKDTDQTDLYANFLNLRRNSLVNMFT